MGPGGQSARSHGRVSMEHPLDWRRRARARRASGAAARCCLPPRHRHGRGPAAQGPRSTVGTGFVFSGSDEICALSCSRSAPAGPWRTCWSRAATCASMRSTAFFSPRRACSLDLFALLVLGIFVAALLERAWDAGVHQLRRAKSAPTRRCACRWPGRSCPGSPASLCSSSRWFSRSCAPLSALLRGDYASRGSHRRRGLAGRGDRERARRPRHSTTKQARGRADARNHAAVCWSSCSRSACPSPP